MQLIETDPDIALIEQPEYKRRWNIEPWDEQQDGACASGCSTAWKLRSSGPVSTLTSVSKLADQCAAMLSSCRWQSCIEGEPTSM